MSKINTLFMIIKKPRKIIKLLGDKRFFDWIPDKQYLKLVYWGETGKKLNIKAPNTFNEKLQWLKLYDRKSEYNIYVNKHAVRSFIAETIGEKYLIPLIDVYNSVEEIDWDVLPNKFVLKCTHGSGSNIICSDKDKFEIEEAKKKLKKWMNKNWYWFGREWPYKNIKPRIISEKYLQGNITDYKFMCFHGEPKLIQIHRNRGSKDRTLDFYDIDWNKTEIRRKMPTAKELIPKPDNLEEMLEVARKLSKNEVHCRIDLYEVKGKVYFGEKTLYTASGFSEFAKEKYDELLGSWIKLPIDSDTV